MMTAGYAPQSPLRLFHDQERKALRRRALFAGVTLLIFLGIQFPLVFLDRALALAFSHRTVSSLSEWLGSLDPVAPILYAIAEYVILIGLPLIIGWVFCRKNGTRLIVKQKIPATHAVGLLFAGLAVCVFANFVALLFEEWMASIGIESPQSPSHSLLQNDSALFLLLSMVSTAVLPAILEELLFRGVILQLLRPAGDLTALILSSVLFGVTHANVTQIPFATVIGLACGYYVLKTGNIFLGMALHFLNNALSVALEYALLDASVAEKIVCNYMLFTALTLLGLLGWLFLYRRAPQAIAPVHNRHPSWLSVGERRRAAWLSPTVLIYLIAMLLLTLLNSQAARIEEWLESLSVLGGFFYG